MRNLATAMAALVLAVAPISTFARSQLDMRHVEREPRFGQAYGTSFRFGGAIGERIAANQRNWLLTAPASNPGMLQMLRDRERNYTVATAPDGLLWWSGEFAGKYLTSAVECYRLTRDNALRKHIEGFVRDLVATQDTDGYMGPFPRNIRMVGPGLWDLWGQYHCMLGLYLWHKETGDAEALAAARRTADYFCGFFLDCGHRVIEAHDEEMNQSCIHIFTLLYEETGEARYLQLVHEIEKDFETPPSGDYIRKSLEGVPFYQLPKPRWEGLHAVQGIAELYFITGEVKYRKAYEQIWWTIAEFDRHNTGGFSSGEQAQGNPYDPRAIETCCTIAWMAISVDMLRMTGDSRVADELELSTFNGMLGAQEPNGRWWTYDTPMNGSRKAATQDIAFQARAGSPELSCCSVNAPRGLGMLSEWAVMSAKDGVVLNYFGPSEFTLRTSSGNAVRLAQKTKYPADGRVSISVTPEKPETFALRVRIPGWSRSTKVTLNGAPADGIVPGHYLVLKREWRSGDSLEIELDMSPRLWVGGKECEGSVSIYRGPILLAYDPRFDEYDPAKLPTISPTGTPRPIAPKTTGPKPMVLLRFPTEDGKGVTLCDFATAGMAGNKYISWLPVEGLKPAPFSRENPMRIVWP